MRWLGEDPGAVPPILKSEDALDGPHPLNAPGDFMLKIVKVFPGGLPTPIRPPACSIHEITLDFAA
jgi:hypothetical protein